MKRIFIALLLLLAGCQYAVDSPIVDGVPAAWPCGSIHYTMSSKSGSWSQYQDVKDLMWEIGLLTNRHIVFDGHRPDLPGSARGEIHFRWEALPAGKQGWADADFSDDNRWIIGADIFISPSAKNHRAVVAHEIGHAFGLGHVSDPQQVMADPVQTYVWGQGDMMGLQATQARCN